MTNMQNITDLAKVKASRAGGLSEDALALLFATQHEAQLRYVAAWGRWLQWTGTRWQNDETLHVYDMARTVCRDALGPKARRKFDAKTVAAVERLAKSDRRVAATVDQWDCDPWLLNTPGGIVDLRTGKMQPHRREDYCTKSTAVAPGGDCPTWRAFLERITGGDKQLELFLQKMFGYVLTGSTQEQALFFGYGTGANGKSVFINTLAGILGDYATTAPMETFIATTGDRHPTDLAGLRGARLVTAIETEEGRRWAESKIKALTGGDKISARFMRQDFFEFIPQFKLFIVGNHKPGLRGVDEAIRRRLRLIPFAITIPPGERDGKLPDKLRAEGGGILQWGIDGCVLWQREGLAQPAAVHAATEEYLGDEDAMAMWMAERCIVKAGFRTTSGDLFSSWKVWADKAGEFVGSRKSFSQTLKARGFEKVEIGHAKMPGFEGIGLKLLGPDESPYERG